MQELPMQAEWYQCTTRRGRAVASKRYVNEQAVGAKDALFVALKDLRIAGPGHEVRDSFGVTMSAIPNSIDTGGWMKSIAKRNVKRRLQLEKEARRG